MPDYGSIKYSINELKRELEREKSIVESNTRKIADNPNSVAVSKWQKLINKHQPRIDEIENILGIRKLQGLTDGQVPSTILKVDTVSSDNPIINISLLSNASEEGRERSLDQALMTQKAIEDQYNQSIFQKDTPAIEKRGYEKFVVFGLLALAFGILLFKK